MAHIKTGGTTKGNRDSIAKRLGVKVNSLYNQFRKAQLKELNVFPDRMQAGRGKMGKKPKDITLIEQGRCLTYANILTLWHGRLLGSTALRKYYQGREKVLEANLAKGTAPLQ